MLLILSLLAITLVLAYASSGASPAKLNRADSLENKPQVDGWCILLMIFLSLFAGLRTDYNDTLAYISGFYNALPVKALWEEGKLELFHNPLFYIYTSAFRHITGNSTVYLLVTSAFVECAFLRAMKHYSVDFTFTVLLFLSVGTFVSTLAAMKQVIAMAIFLLALPSLEKRQWLKYYLAIFIAMLFHSYAAIFVIVPFCRQRPWSGFTYGVVAVLVFVMLNFQTAISGFLDFADDMGKEIAEYEVFDNHSVNIFRAAVYAVPPLLSFAFRRQLFIDSTPMENTFVHMSILSFAFMLLGTNAGANMFGRMATYFEIGTLFCVPWMLKKLFTKNSYRIMSWFAGGCYVGYYLYAYGIAQNFAKEYKTVFDNWFR